MFVYVCVFVKLMKISLAVVIIRPKIKIKTKAPDEENPNNKYRYNSCCIRVAKLESFRCVFVFSFCARSLDTIMTQTEKKLKKKKNK